MKTIYYNGMIYTGELPLVEAFAVEGDRFVAAGTDAQVRGLAQKGDCLVDLEGRFVCSGFQDSHMHLLNFGHALWAAQLAKRTESLADLIACMQEFAEATERRPGDWILGRGWNQDYFADADRMPDRYDLDQVSRTEPVCAVRACGHCLVVNSAALKLLGVTKDSPQSDGGRIGMEQGEPDGRFFDNAMDPVLDAIPVPDKEAVKDRIRAACKALNAYGVTSCDSDDYSAFRKIPWQTINQAFRELEEAGQLTVRVYEQCNFTDLETLREFVEAGNGTEKERGEGSSERPSERRFRIGPLKMLGDGALGSRTAFLKKPYADDPSTCGLPVFSQETLDEMIGYAHAHGMQAAVHAIGDACLDRVLHAYEKALSEHPAEDHRHGIVHCQITRPDQLETIQRLGLHVYAQTIFLDYDTQIVEKRVGKELAATSYSWKTLMRNGVSVSNGSDCPVELPDVMAGIQCAVTRKPLSGQLPPYLPDQAFTVREAIDSYTIESAKASFEEAEKGQIRPGMLADFVILDENPFAVAPERIREIKVRATYVGGQKVYGEDEL